MKYSQNSKIMQISEKTLIIGVDIARSTSPELLITEA